MKGYLVFIGSVTFVGIMLAHFVYFLFLLVESSISRAMGV